VVAAPAPSAVTAWFARSMPFRIAVRRSEPARSAGWSASTSARTARLAARSASGVEPSPSATASTAEPSSSGISAAASSLAVRPGQAAEKIAASPRAISCSAAPSTGCPTRSTGAADSSMARDRPGPPHRSREDAAAALRLLDPLDPADQRGAAHRDAPVARGGEHLVEGALDQRDQAVVHVLLGPEEVLEALHPLEVGDRDAAGVREDVGHHEDAARAQHLVALDGGGVVRALDHQPAGDAVGVALGDLPLYRGGHEDLAGQQQQVGIV